MIWNWLSILRSRRLTLISAAIVSLIMTALSAPTLSDMMDGLSPERAFRWEPAGPYGGDARCLAMDPQNAKIAYLGTGDGQVFQSVDGGRSWRLIQPGFTRRGFSIQSLLVDRRDSRRLFIGGWTVRGDQDRGGVFVSENRGVTWTPVAGLEGQAIRAFVQSPSHPEIFVAGALDAVFRSEDGAQTWERLSYEHPEFKNIESVALDPKNPDIMYVGTWHLPWKTTDGGRDWKLIGNSAVGMVDDSDIFSIVVDYSDTDTVYMSACSGIYRSANAGQKWTKIQGIPSSSRRTQVIVQHPTTPSVVYAGTTQGLWKSEDHGRRWVLITNRRLLIHDILIHPARPDRVVLATASGILISDSGDRFSPSNTGFSHWTVSALHPDVEIASRLYVSVLSADPGTGFYISQNQGASWTELGRGLQGVDIYSLLQFRASPKLLFAGTNSGLYRSVDRGETWKPFRLPGTSRGRKRTRQTRSAAPGGIATGPPDPQSRVLALVPRDDVGQALLLTDSGLYEGHMERGKWVRLIQAEKGERFLCVAGTTTEEIYLGTSRGLRVSRPGVQRWSFHPVEGRSVPVQAIVVDHVSPASIYVGTQFGLFRVEQDGELATWSRLGRGLPPISVSTLIVSAGSGHELVVGDQRFGGLYRSQDRGEHWERIDSGFASPRVSVVDFAADRPGWLLVGTLNGGLYIGKGSSVTAEGIDSVMPSRIPAEEDQ